MNRSDEVSKKWEKLRGEIKELKDTIDKKKKVNKELEDYLEKIRKESQST